jgi:hypothetical protein
VLEEEGDAGFRVAGGLRRAEVPGTPSSLQTTVERMEAGERI